MEKSVRQKMFNRIERWQQSGWKQKPWCRKNKIAYATFHYWYKRYREHRNVTAKKTGNDFIKVTMAEPVTAAGWCELALANGKKLIFQQPVSAEFLRLLID
jgi:hypothetical protein